MRILVGLCIAACISIAGWLLWARHVARVAEARMMIELRDVCAPLPRACHVDPCDDGTVTAAIAQWIAVRTDAERDPEAHASLPMVRDLLRTTHAAHMGTGTGASFFELDPALPLILRTARDGVAVVPTLPAVDRIPICTDTLALARDIALTGNMLALSQAGALVTRTLAACDPVFDAIPPASRPVVAQTLARIRAGFPTFAQALERELVYVRLRELGALLSTSARSELPSTASALIGRSSTFSFDAYLEPQIRARHDALLAAYRAPVAERARRLAAAPRKGVFADDMERTASFASTYEATLATLDAVVARLR